MQQRPSRMDKSMLAEFSAAYKIVVRYNPQDAAKRCPDGLIFHLPPPLSNIEVKKRRDNHERQKQVNDLPILYFALIKLNPWYDVFLFAQQQRLTLLLAASPQITAWLIAVS